MNAEINRLVAAITKITTVYLVRLARAGDTAGLLKYSLRLADYSTRLAVLLAPPLTLEEKADLDVPEPLSSDPTVAMAQIRAAVGLPLEFNETGASKAVDNETLIAAATPEQRAQLALLGLFQPIDSHPEVDYSLFKRYYDKQGDDWKPKAEYLDTGTWAAYMASQ